MKILALETSTELCSAALWLDGKIDAREAAAGQRNSELLLPMVDALLTAHALSARDLDGIAFGSGPGAFTGVRIACGVAQGIAFGVDVPVAGIGTLLALAEASGERRVVCCLDARMGEIYHAAYEKTGDGWREIIAPGLYKPAAAPDLPAGRWSGCGSGFVVFREEMATRYTGSIARVIEGIVPHAREVAVLAARQFARGGAADAADAAPLYVRNKVALKVRER
ncbi:MAG: tRNA (adenosine(37)-N6)-threonylcarbamoyltransferase complex dimerization subunit type 1 TsaB [Burkholderiales bacterium]